MTIKLKHRIAACVMLAMIAGGSAANTDFAADAGAADSPSLTTDFRQIVQSAKERVFPAVIYIKCLRESHESGKKSMMEVGGSGVIISETGEALTNWHVVEKAVSVRCLLSDGRAMKARVVGSDKPTDLALLQLELPDGSSGLPWAEIDSATQPQEGDFVMAMGAPFGLNRSVSIGIISCANRYLPETSEYSHWLQTDAAINPGNSGGPLVNTDGRIVGLNARGMSGWADNLGFAIPAQTMLELVPQLREHGRVRWSWTGLQLQPLRDFDRDMYFDGTDGVIVAETDAESPARRAGMKPRDRIMRVNGEPLTALTEEDLPTIRRWLGLLPMHEPATFEVQRGGELRQFELSPREKGDVEGEELDLPRWDLTIKAINQFDNEDLYFYRKEGVFVYGVEWPGNAGNAGLSTGDILLTIDGQEVKTLAEVQAAYDKAMAEIDERHKLMVQVLRSGLPRQLVLDFSRDFEKE